MVRALFIVVLSAALARGENELQHELHAVLGEKSGNVLEKDADKVLYETENLERAAFRKNAPWDKSLTGELEGDEEKLIEKVPR
jgi:hypothetical protein